jgi:hypothetical protein
LTVKQDDAIAQRKQGVIFAPADVPAWQISGAALPNNNTAGANALAAVDLDAQPLTGRFPAIADGALTFLMSHDFL